MIIEEGVRFQFDSDKKRKLSALFRKLFYDSTEKKLATVSVKRTDGSYDYNVSYGENLDIPFGNLMEIISKAQDLGVARLEANPDLNNLEIGVSYYQIQRLGVFNRK